MIDCVLNVEDVLYIYSESNVEDFEDMYYCIEEE